MNPRRLYRCRSDRQLAGVAGGMAEYLDVDPTVVRVLWILSAFLGGFTILLYVILAFVIPLEPIEMTAPGYEPGVGAAGAAEGAATVTESGTPAESTPAPSTPAPQWAAHAGPAPHGAWHAPVHERRHRDGNSGRGAIVFGTLLVVFGAIALAGPLIPGWAASAAIGPAFVLALGIALLAGAIRRPASER